MLTSDQLGEMSPAMLGQLFSEAVSLCFPNQPWTKVAPKLCTSTATIHRWRVGEGDPRLAILYMQHLTLTNITDLGERAEQAMDTIAQLSQVLSLLGTDLKRFTDGTGAVVLPSEIEQGGGPS